VSKELGEVLNINAELTALVKRQQLEIDKLKHQLAELIRRIYGSSSEKFDPDQLKLFDPEETKKPDAAVPADPEPAAKPARQRSHTQRLKKSIEDLPTTREVIEPEGISTSEWKCIGEEVTEELHYQPASYHRHLIIRPKYARRVESLDESNIATAPLPPRLLEGSVLTPSLLAGIMTSKYCWHQPLFRQEQMMKTAGIDCSRSLMCHWLGHGGRLLLPLHQALKGQLLACDYLQADETPIDYLDPGHGSTRKGYLWTLHNPQLGVVYEWHTGRGQQHLAELMGDDFQGILQHDAYQPYLTLARDRQLRQVACMAHIRRGFDKALQDRPEVAGWFLRQFARLYRIEAELRSSRAGPEERTRRRRTESRPIYHLLKKAVLHLRQNRPILPASPLGKALTYALGQLPHMETWIEHGQVEIDNNLVENSIRPTKLGAKNWLFFGSAQSGTMGAVLYTLVENVRRLNRDPFEYLTWVFCELARNPQPENPEDLLPQAWAKAKPEGRQLRAA
jgi:transposase